MLDGNKDIDSLFADKLKGMTMQPDPKVWKGINGQLVAQKRKKRVVLFITGAAVAASLIFLFTLSNRALLDGTEPGMELAGVVSSENEDAQKDSKEVTPLVSEHTKENQTPDKSNDTKYVSGKIKSALTKEKELIQKWMIDVNVNSTDLIQINNTKTELPGQLAGNNLSKEEPMMLLADKLQIQKNIWLLERQKKEEVKQNRWSVIGQVSSAYTNEKSNDNASGLISLGGGIKVNYKLNKKLALQTGLKYNQIGQDFSTGSSRLFMADPSSQSLAGNELDGVEFLPSHTSAGPIKFKSQGKENVDVNSEYLRASSSSSSELAQSFEMIEIPLLLRYNLIQKRVGLFVTGGVSANWLLSNGVYDTSNGRRKVGEIDNLRTTNFSSHFGLGLEYRLSSKFHLGLEPSFKYYINSLSKDGNFNYKPYSIGVQTGIRYNF